MKFYYQGRNEEGHYEEMFIEATADNPHCATDTLHRTWLEFEDGHWATAGIPSHHGGKVGDDSAARGLRVEQ